MWWNGLKMRALVSLVIVAALAFATAPASADKPSSAGGKEEHSKSSKKYKQEAKGKKAKPVVGMAGIGIMISTTSSNIISCC